MNMTTRFRGTLLQACKLTALLLGPTLSACAPGYMKASDLERRGQGPTACAESCEDLKMKMVAMVLVSDTLPGCVCQVLEVQGAAPAVQAAPAAPPPAAPAPAPTPAPAPVPAPATAPVPGAAPPPAGPTSGDATKPGAAAVTTGYVVIAAAAAVQQQHQRRKEADQKQHIP
jgi:hypothetical protein